MAGDSGLAKKGEGGGWDCKERACERIASAQRSPATTTSFCDCAALALASACSWASFSASLSSEFAAPAPSNVLTRLAAGRVPRSP